jgi:hypothetical protein
MSILLKDPPRHRGEKNMNVAAFHPSFFNISEDFISFMKILGFAS